MSPLARQINLIILEKEKRSVFLSWNCNIQVYLKSFFKTIKVKQYKKYAPGRAKILSTWKSPFDRKKTHKIYSENKKLRCLLEIGSMNQFHPIAAVYRKALHGLSFRYSGSIY